MIEYEWVNENLTVVFLNRKRVGKIRRYVGSDGVGYQYFPKGHNEGGEVFKTSSQCKESLEQG